MPTGSTTRRTDGRADGNPTNLRHCTVDGCRGLFYARGWCQSHYNRWNYLGRPDDFPPPVRRRVPAKPLPASFRLFTG